MRKARSSAVILGLLLAAACSLGGCAYTTVTSDIEKPKAGPKVATGTSALMPEVVDQRAWQESHSDQADPNIRIFAPEITDIMRKGMVEQGLFRQLDRPTGPLTGKDQKILRINVSSFKWANQGQNEWVVAQLLADGVFLPVYTAVTLVSAGEIDMGGYIFPSTKIGTNINFSAVYQEDNLTVLSREYAVSLPMGAVSERRLRDSLSDKSRTGVKLGKEQGMLALALASETMARDPRWGFLPQYRILAKAEEKASKGSASELIQAARTAMPLLKETKYSAEVAKILRDGSLTAFARAGIVNDIKIRRLGLSNTDQLPPADRLDEETAEKLFHDPALELSLVKSELISRSLALAAKAMAPPSVAPKKAAAQKAGPQKGVMEGVPAGPSSAAGAELPATPTKVKLLEPRGLDKEAAKPEVRAADKVAAPDPARVKAMRQAFIAELAADLKQKTNVQELLLKQADKAVGPDWKNMKVLLQAVDSPATRAYLAKRES